MSVFAKGMSMAANLVTIPLTLRYLGPEQYGIWATISSCFLLLTSADLGIGNGLINQIADADGRNDKPAIARLVAAGFFLLSGVALTFLILGGIVNAIKPITDLLNLQSAVAT